MLFLGNWSSENGGVRLGTHQWRPGSEGGRERDGGNKVEEEEVLELRLNLYRWVKFE